MLRWKSSLKPAAAAPSTGIALEDYSATTVSGTSSQSPVVNIPAVSVDDILIFYCATYDNADPTSSPPSGWTKIIEQDSSSIYGSTVAAYWKRVTVDAAATTETWTGLYPNNESVYIWVGAYSGCTTSGSPIDVSVGSGWHSGTSHSNSFTTTVDNAMVVSMAGVFNYSTTWSPDGEIVDLEFQDNINAWASVNGTIEPTAGSHTVTASWASGTRSAIVTVALKPPSTYILEERFEESDSGGALGSSTDGYDSSLVSAEVTTTGSTIDPDESTSAVLSGSQSLEIDSASGDNYVEFDFGADYDELWFHVEINRIYSTTSNRNIIKFFNQSGTIAAGLGGNSSSKPTVLGASATTSFTYANTSAVDHFWLHWVRNSTSTFYFGANTSTRPTSGGDVVSFTAADVAIGKFQIGIFNRSGNYRYDDILVSTSAIGDDP